jgi:hypothetical protein
MLAMGVAGGASVSLFFIFLIEKALSRVAMLAMGVAGGASVRFFF